LVFLSYPFLEPLALSNNSQALPLFARGLDKFYGFYSGTPEEAAPLQKLVDTKVAVV
jgi:hypothetical protein